MRAPPRMGLSAHPTMEQAHLPPERMRQPDLPAFLHSKAHQDVRLQCDRPGKPMTGAVVSRHTRYSGREGTPVPCTGLSAERLNWLV